jgi:hypothetical protein
MKDFIELNVTDLTTDGINSYLFGIDEIEEVLHFIAILEKYSPVLSYDIQKNIV